MYFMVVNLQFGKQLRETELLEEAGRTATEAVENIRTVQSLNKQSAFIREYSQHLQTPFRFNSNITHIYAIFQIYLSACWWFHVCVSTCLLVSVAYMSGICICFETRITKFYKYYLRHKLVCCTISHVGPSVSRSPASIWRFSENFHIFIIRLDSHFNQFKNDGSFLEYWKEWSYSTNRSCGWQSRVHYHIGCFKMLFCMFILAISWKLQLLCYS